MSDVRYKIELRKATAQIEGDLVENARKFLCYYKVYRETDLEESQIRNLVRISEETRSLEAIESFIRYQMGRHDAWQFRPKKEDEMFGEALIHRIARLRIDNQETIEELAEDFDKKEPEIFWHIVRLYLGYINWYFAYCRKPLSECP